jgi:hypothetical protein
VPAEANGWQSSVRRSIARLVPHPGRKTSSQGVTASGAARIVGDHNMSRPVARRQFRRSTTSSASRRMARSAFSLAAPALMSSLSVDPAQPFPLVRLAGDAADLSLSGRRGCWVASPPLLRPTERPTAVWASTPRHRRIGYWIFATPTGPLRGKPWLPRKVSSPDRSNGPAGLVPSTAIAPDEPRQVPRLRFIRRAR